jgi:hypothetical protein
MKSEIIDKELINWEEFLVFQAKGYKGLRCNGTWVRVTFICKCGNIYETNYNSQIKRNPKYNDLCFACAMSRNRTNQNAARPEGWSSEKEHRDKISKGVKNHYQKHLGSAQRRAKVRGRNLLSQPYDKHKFSPAKGTVRDIPYSSIAEKIFIEWMLEQQCKIIACDDLIPYKDKGKERLYNPDYIVINDQQTIVYEIKGDYKKNFVKCKTIKHLITYDIANVELKMKAGVKFYRKKGWKFKLMTLDNKEFSLRYNRELRKRRLKNKPEW